METNNNINQPTEPKLISSGPVFEAGPGWGAKTKSWFKQYLWKVILPMLILVLGAYAVYYFNNSESPFVQTTPTPPTGGSISTATISQTVQRGDNRTVIARRILSDYLAKLSDKSLTAGQKVFIENKLSQTVSQTALKIGQQIQLATADIKNAIDQAKKLTQFQLQSWEAIARKAGIK